MALDTWRTLFRECLGGRGSQYCEEVVPLLVAVDQGVKPSLLWDVCTADTSGLLALLNQARAKGLLGSKLVLVELGLDVFIVNVPAVTRTLVNIIASTQTWLIDISGSVPKVATNENHQEFHTYLTSIIAQLNIGSTDAGMTDSSVGSLSTQNGDVNSPNSSTTTNTPQAPPPPPPSDTSVGEIKAVEVKLPEDLNLSTIFGCMLGYPHIYWWQGESGGNSLSGMPLKVFKLSAECAVDGSVVELYSFSIPEALEGDLRPGIEHWGNVTNARIEQAASFSNASFKCDSVLCLSVALHGSLPEAWNYASLARVSCPRDPNTQDTWSRLTNALVDRWHLPMINDQARNSGFKRAIEKAVTEGHHTVLDIGSGTGLLSLYAKKAGATEVYACEVDKFMCEMGKDILKLNDGTSNISILNKHSNNINIPQDIPQRVSLVVSETVDAGLLGEHILTTLQQAWHHHLLPPPSPPLLEAATSMTTTTLEIKATPVQEEVNGIQEKANDLKKIAKKIPEKASGATEVASIAQEKVSGSQEKAQKIPEKSTDIQKQRNTKNVKKEAKNIQEKANGIQERNASEVKKKNKNIRKRAKNIPAEISGVQNQFNINQEKAYVVQERDTKADAVSCEPLQSSLNSDAVTGDASADKKLGNRSKHTHCEDGPNNAANGTASDIENGLPLATCGRVIPSKAEVFIALISCEYIAKQTRLIDNHFSYFKNKTVCVKLDEPYMSEKLSQVPGGFQLLSKWTHITTINFNSIDDILRHQQGDNNGTLDIQCTESGTIDAIVLAFTLHLDDTECINTFPETLHTQWENAVYPVLHPTHLEASDRVAVNVECEGVMRLSVHESYLSSDATGEKNLYLQASALRFLNSNTFTSVFTSAAESIATKLGIDSKSKTATDSQCPLVICDTTPFPVAGLRLLSLLPHSRLYVEEEEVQRALVEVGVEAGLSEDLEEAVDVLFLWPTTGEGTLKDDFVKKILLYRLMLSEEGMVFPQEVDLVVGVVGSPTLTSMTRVDDANTCGARLAEVFNLVQLMAK
ncbi:hypothetical protein Pmani_035554 [Petrolisthes manimaculis]|uniref:Uncharacterized protein n=1 Tax=Petrolisthes manimaculis TaxID=1843537 RepID=A0AAE1NLI0_9EUCA|nr:hypothetical protein Pmani_035554 [Petrolisthes manimaculis]